MWPENDLAIEVALRCHWDRSLGAMGGRVWNGVWSSEIEAVMRARRVKPADRWHLMDQVRLFVRVACNELNELENQRAEQRRSK